MSIKVQCGACGKTSEVPDAWAGKKGRCKGCGGAIAVPAAETSLRVQTEAIVPLSLKPEILPTTIEPPVHRVVMVSAEVAPVPCPYCAEPIQVAARKCRHCGEFLDPTLRQAVVQSAPASPPPQPSVVIHNTVTAAARATAFAKAGRQPMGCCSVVVLGLMALFVIGSLNSSPRRQQREPLPAPAPRLVPPPFAPPSAVSAEPPKVEPPPMPPEETKGPAETIEERAKRERVRTLEIRKSRRGN